MYFISAACAVTGLLVWCIVVAALVLALGGSFVCGVERTGPVVVIACQSPAFGGNPNAAR